MPLTAHEFEVPREWTLHVREWAGQKTRKSLFAAQYRPDEARCIVAFVDGDGVKRTIAIPDNSPAGILKVWLGGGTQCPYVELSLRLGPAVVENTNDPKDNTMTIRWYAGTKDCGTAMPNGEGLQQRVPIPLTENVDIPTPPQDFSTALYNARWGEWKEGDLTAAGLQQVPSSFRNCNRPQRLDWMGRDPACFHLNMNIDRFDAEAQSWGRTFRILKDQAGPISVFMRGHWAMAKHWKTFCAQPSPTLPTWWLYARLVGSNRHMVSHEPDTMPNIFGETHYLLYAKRPNKWVEGGRGPLGSEEEGADRDVLITTCEIVPIGPKVSFAATKEYETFVKGGLIMEMRHQERERSRTLNGMAECRVVASQTLVAQADPFSFVVIARIRLSTAMQDMGLELPQAGEDVEITFREGLSGDGGEECWTGRVVDHAIGRRDWGNVTMLAQRGRTEASCIIPDVCLAQFRFGFAGVPVKKLSRNVDWLLFGEPAYGIPPHSDWHDLLLGQENEALEALAPRPVTIGPRLESIVEAMRHSLNADQFSALVTAMAPKGILSLVRGPPGTGKTMLGQSIVDVGYRVGLKVMICGPSNQACDVIAERLQTHFRESGYPEGEVFRVRREAFERYEDEWDGIPGFAEEEGDEADPAVVRKMELSQLPDPTMLHSMERLLINSERNKVDALSILHYVYRRRREIMDESDEDGDVGYIAAEGRTKDSVEKTLMANFNMLSNKVLYDNQSMALVKPGEVAAIAATRNLAAERKQLQQDLNAAWLELKRYYVSKASVVICTLGNSHSKTLKTFRPDLLLVDEAAHAHEPEVLLPIGRFYSSIKSIVLMGDEEQLPPTVTSEQRNEFAAQHGMSLFARMQLTGVKAITLGCQYRMSPDISKIIRENFYGGKLVDADSTRIGNERAAFAEFAREFGGRHVQSAPSHSLFVHVGGSELLREKQGPSKANFHFQVAVLHVVEAMTAHGLDPAKILVIAFYKAQVAGLRRLFLHHNVRVDVSTVDAAQGGERDFVIVDMVTPGHGDEGLGFLSIPNRLNVALSRAKSGRVVVGDIQMGTGAVEGRRRGAGLLRQLCDDHKDDRISFDARPHVERFNAVFRPEGFVAVSARTENYEPQAMLPSQWGGHLEGEGGGEWTGAVTGEIGGVEATGWGDINPDEHSSPPGRTHNSAEDDVGWGGATASEEGVWGGEVALDWDAAGGGVVTRWGGE